MKTLFYIAVVGLVIGCFAFTMHLDYQDNNSPAMVNVAGHN